MILLCEITTKRLSLQQISHFSVEIYSMRKTIIIILNLAISTICLALLYFYQSYGLVPMMACFCFSLSFYYLVSFYVDCWRADDSVHPFFFRKLSSNVKLYGVSVVSITTVLWLAYIAELADLLSPNYQKLVAIQLPLFMCASLAMTNSIVGSKLSSYVMSSFVKRETFIMWLLPILISLLSTYVLFPISPFVASLVGIVLLFICVLSPLKRVLGVSVRA